MPSYHSELDHPGVQRCAETVRRGIRAPVYHAVLGGCGHRLPYLPTLTANNLVVMASTNKEGIRPPSHQERVVCTKSMVPVHTIYQSLGRTRQGIFSSGLTNTPGLNGSSNPGLHPTKAIYPGFTSGNHHIIYLPQVSEHGNAQIASPRQDSSARLVMYPCPVDSTLTTRT